MLKWTASAQKLAQNSPSAVSVKATTRFNEAKRRQRRATIANKENIPYTSTPMVERVRNSPMALAPLADILNLTPESSSFTATSHSPTPPQRRRVAIRSVATDVSIQRHRQRRHSTVGFSLPLAAAAVSSYASTLPRYEEEYSPSAGLPTGQQLALRGLLPEPFLGNARYFKTPELTKERVQATGKTPNNRKSLPQKRNLDQEFEEIAHEECGVRNAATAEVVNNTVFSSAKMGDQTLDKLIDAILDSARKEEKKRKPRKSFNLRRRTLLKNHTDCGGTQDLVLSPSYAAGDDPASDLSFLVVEPAMTATQTEHRESLIVGSPSTVQPSNLPVTPAPATPLPGTPIPATVLRKLPTPAPHTLLRSVVPHLRGASRNDSFTLDTPPVRRLRKKRRQTLATETEITKKFKVDARSYFEVGLALPSIYV